MNKKFLADIQIIKNAINTNKLVIFAGAGISIDANVPSWSSLIDRIKDELDLPDGEKDYLKIAQIYFNDRQEKEYIEKIRASLGHKKLRYNEIHEELFELNPEHILTTNFEDLLEQVITKNSLPYSIIREDKDLPYSNNTKLLVKIHGDLDTGNLVFKEDDYLGYSQNHPLLDSFIKSVFSTKVVLFIGYSFNDYNLKQIVQYVRNILGNNFQNAYLLSIDKEVHQSHRQYLKKKGINVINYFDADYIEQKIEKSISKNYIDDFLKEDNIYGRKSNYLKEVKSLSEKGQLLLNFLRFLRFYDKLAISINEKNVIDQIYNSLIRFEEVKYLPQNFISKLYPFKSESGFEHLIEKTSLLLKNKYLVDLFFNKIDIENSEIKLTELENSDKKKIEYILRKLNNSLIFYVVKENEKSDSFGYKGFSDEGKSIDYHSLTICDCTKCKYERFQIEESLKETNSYNISDTTDISEDMQKAFLNYKFGNYFQSFNMFEEIASKAWTNQKYITYYIAKTNMKALKNFLSWELQINDKEKDSVLTKIEDIDIDKLIFLIPYRSNDEYHILKIIRDDKVLEDVQNKINEYYEKILDTYKLYKNNKHSFSSGPYYPQLLYIELYKLLTFYNENYIINDEFSHFKAIVNKAVDAFIINYATDNRYGGKIQEFNIGFFEMAIPYINSDGFIKILNEYNIQEFKFKPEDLEKVLTYCNNFLNSYFEKNIFFGRESKSDIIEAQLKKYSFETKTKTIFNNIMIFLSLIELNKEQFETIKNNLFTFLSLEKILYGSSIKHAKNFLAKNYKNFNLEDCKKLLEIVHNNHSKYDRHDIFGLIAGICYEDKYEIINDTEYAKKILFDLEYYNKDSKDITDLWHMSNEKVKDYYYKIIIQRLDTNFDEELYGNAVLGEIIDFNLYFENFISSLNVINNDIKKDGYLIENGEPNLYHSPFYHKLLFLYQLGIKGNDQRLQKLTSLYEFMKFYIFREKYDFSKFKIEWLYLFDNEIIFNEIKKIKPLKKIIETSLKEKYDEELAKIYAQYFI